LLSLVTAVGLIFLLPSTNQLGEKSKAVKNKASLFIPTILTLLYALSFATLPPIFRAAIAITALGYTMIVYCAQRKFTPGLGGLLLLALPVTASLQFYLGYPMRVFVGLLASPMLNLAGFAVVREGACLKWGDQLIVIDAPCSGVRMMWAALFLTFTLAALNQFGWLKSGLAVLLSFIAVLLGNTLRAAALFYLEAGIIHLPAWAHDAAGVIVFLVLAVGLVIVNKELQRVKLCVQS
ncbi:MAG TPA: archaeosortase/exosortase family protein, partial [Blastocatellia bacterium]|nr:archaeosortase/exosortase family protein [Blastocatellia bacterium]